MVAGSVPGQPVRGTLVSGGLIPSGGAIAEAAIHDGQDKMSDSLIDALLLVGGVIFSWYLIVGLRAGKMAVPGFVFLVGNRTQVPMLFWAMAAYNFIFAVGCFVVAMSSILPVS